jgi:starch phosphorylase
MKAAINGALNMSTLDGWWCEGYNPKAGWAIGSGEVYEDVGYQDMVESQAIYNILENEVVPLFYTRSADNLPRAWIRRMKNSIKWLTPSFNTDRMVADYTQNFYKPAADKWEYLNEQTCSRAKAFSQWKSNMCSRWSEFDIKDVQVQIKNGQEDKQLHPNKSQLKVGSELNVKALIKLGNVNPDDVSVELYHGPLNAWGDISEGSAVRMNHQGKSGQDGEHLYSGLMRCKSSGRQGLAVRVLPRHTDLIDPYDMGLILWEKTS